MQHIPYLLSYPKIPRQYYWLLEIVFTIPYNSFPLPRHSFLYSVHSLSIFPGYKNICKPESFDTNISHQLFDNITSFVNSQH